MRFVMFYQSLVSDWNHGNAHFLRGVASELVARGHEVAIYEPRDGWSLHGLVDEAGPRAIAEFETEFPHLRSTFYDVDTVDLAAVLEGADVVLVHEWNDERLVRRLGEQRKRDGGFLLLFHDTHHRAVTEPETIDRFGVESYDGVLAYGSALRDVYEERGLAARAWTWHEAADTRVFYPRGGEREPALVWIGNWGDDERTAELAEFVFGPVQRLAIRGQVYGVRYPRDARDALARAGLAYRGWIANYRVPEVLARHAVTVHVPRRPYVDALPGIPTIRVFEALACGIPLVSAPWDDVEGLFTPGADFLVARDGEEAARHIRAVVSDRELAAELAERGRRTVLARHTCAHRVDELLGICESLGASLAAEVAA